ncbi:3-hydroxyacyl-CoA dehydrogenase/enoyl-CoA hydratase family protein [Chitinimonas sp. BJB300]|uniref:3-hydroxyacyl-CoA dehydrogenase/enoyl-CoA hydratase family protein n=1 Tax=Chitinimonas sp. BJB300 TaxID=1559339 RepID=UPI000C0DD12B|nr:3-hydroxyacyl-CoA dehydrogenase/enoyl-CoA hydratase family protein [Chitinimonas sp. BJB300]PHV11460.1 3-hydroxyacyl-CoA dehydrogenase [Chitinimonas sp. BJB300]TSJ87214.1 3-hydroxyacyl-CoA dehydrogenase/enoyl-CoA hydratase family protein [Chitinimonas sp. BJB300]
MSQSKFIVRKVAVLGAGVMGAQIAAHLANANVEAILFDLPAKEGPKSGIALKAIEGLKKQNPAPLASKGRADFITPANYDEHLHLLKDCDLVIEAIAERMDWKLGLYEKVAPHLGVNTIFATNTSGLSINKLAEGTPESMRARFCGIHFFNPPRYMHLVEIIPCVTSDAAMLDQLEAFLATTLGKGVVRAKDTPNFVANRIGVYSMLAAIHNAEKFGIRFDIVDDLTGPRLGRPKSATFRTADVVGLDTFAHVVKTMQDTLPDDPWHALFQSPVWLQKLIEGGALGAKSKVGIYKKEGKTKLVLDPSNGQYVEANKKGDDAVKELMKIKDPGKRLLKLKESTNPEAQFLWACFRDVFHYIAVHLDTVADNARDVDLAIRWGFGWNEGPFETWQAAGWKQVAEWVKADIDAGKTIVNTPLPAWVFKRDGVHEAAGSYSASKNALVPRSALDVYQRQLFPAKLVGEAEPVYGETVFENEGVRAWTSGDGVLVVSFLSKAHAIGPAVLEGINKSLDLAEAQFKSVVIWHPEEPFSVGADLSSMLPAFMAGDWDSIEKMLSDFQAMTMRLRYSQVPVVSATRGYVFGGGCEVCLHSDRVVAHLESYVGLVEVGVGLLPGAGGTKEFALRAANEARGDVFAALKDRYMTIATANVAKSAEEAKELGFFRESDVIVFNQYELLFVAKQQAIALAESGYRAPLKVKGFPVAGRSGAASIKGQLTNMMEGGFISKHDYHIGALIADIITGGDVEAGTLVDEQWILDLERKGFLSLLKNEKTQERIAYMLQNNKPLRN